MTWVLLRGLARESAHWGGFRASLSAGLGGAAVETIDLPGSGRFRAARCPLDVASIVETCRVEAQRRGLRRPLDLVAISMGAMVAIEWARRFPAEVRRAVLINTSVRPFAPFHRRLRPASYGAVLRALVARDVVTRERTILQLTSNDPLVRDAIAPDFAAIARLRPVTRANALRQLLAAARYRGPAAPPACAVLLVASTHDRLVDVRCSQALAQAWGVPLVQHPRAGHDLPLDDAAWLVERIREWAGPPDQEL